MRTCIPMIYYTYPNVHKVAIEVDRSNSDSVNLLQKN